MSVPFQHTTLSAISTSRTCRGFIMVTIVPGTLFIGQVVMLRASSTTMSASLPGVSVPTFVQDPVRGSARDRGHLDDLTRRDQLRDRHAPGVAFPEGEVVGQRTLQAAGAPHQRERVGRHVGLDVGAQAGQEPVIERLLKRRHPVPHLASGPPFVSLRQASKP